MYMSQTNMGALDFIFTNTSRDGSCMGKVSGHLVVQQSEAKAKGLFFCVQKRVLFGSETYLLQPDPKNYHMQIPLILTSTSLFMST